MNWSSVHAECELQTSINRKNTTSTKVNNVYSPITLFSSVAAYILGINMLIGRMLLCRLSMFFCARRFLISNNYSTEDLSLVFLWSDVICVMYTL